VKKQYALILALVVIVLWGGAISCKSAPKVPEEEELLAEVSPLLEDIIQEVTDDGILPEPGVIEPAIFAEDKLGNEDIEEEPVLAEEFPVNDGEYEDDFLAFGEPEFPDTVAVSEPEPEPPQVINPPIVTAVSPPIAPEPPRQTAVAPPSPVTPPPVVTSPSPPPASPPPPPPVTPPRVTPPPPVIIEEIPPELSSLYDENDLSYPPTDIRDWQDDAMVFSRIVRATAGQMVEIPFRGTGWVYLGENSAQRGIIYDSRRLDSEGQSFMFRTQSPGEYVLKFYRQDFIRDFILNDYVQVIVGTPPETAGAGWFNPSTDRSRVVAEPRWPSPIAEAQALRPQPPAPAQEAAASRTQEPPAAAAPVQSPPAQSVPPRGTQPVPGSVAAAPTQPPANAVQPVSPPPSALPAAPETPPGIDPGLYLEKAKEEFDAGRIAAAIAFLDQFRGYYPLESDELLWLYGQFYEANSPSRNILTSLGYYNRLVDEYPQSSRYDDARRRIAYLQRYYINIH
jgi:hypothetical protein